MDAAQIQARSTLTCPHCGHKATETMPTDACALSADPGSARHWRVGRLLWGGRSWIGAAAQPALIFSAGIRV